MFCYSTLKRLTAISSISTPADKSFEYFELVLQWPPAFGTSVGNQIPYWTIHGLWPSRLKNYKTYPCTCTNEAFNEGAISSLTGDMKYYWPTLSQSNSNSWFWSHEWEKHGTCSSPYISSQFNYFDTTLKLRKQIDPAKLLGNLVPSKTPYPFNLVYEKLSKSGSVIMHCKNPGTPNQSLVEINICMTASKTPTQFGCPAVLRDQSGLCDPAFPVTIRPPSVPSRG